MLHWLQLPFVYDDNKSIFENRRDSQDFFSCLTNIRCAIVEGGHRCEAASRTLQGYKLCDLIPLAHKVNEIDVPESSTLFRPVQTKIYYSQDNDVQLDGTLMQFL